ncbi:MAG: ABC transporter permease subunit [Methanoregula sp.]
MNWQIIRAIAEKDFAEVLKNRIAVSGAIVLSVIFAVGFPLLITGIHTMVPGGGSQASLDDIAKIIPADLQGQIAALSPEQLPIVLILGYLVAPLFLILPLMLSCIIAAEAFVGEKERKTLEALLYTPATDGELFLGKALAAIIPGIVYTWVNFAIFAIVTNFAGFPVMGRFWFPTASWWGLMIFVVPAVVLLGVAATVIVSTRVSTFMEAYQASGILVIVILVLMVAQATGLLFLSPLVAVIVGLVLLVIDGCLIWIGIRMFSRSELIARI